MSFYFAYRENFIAKALNSLGVENFSIEVFNRLYETYEKEIFNKVDSQFLKENK